MALKSSRCSSSTKIPHIYNPEFASSKNDLQQLHEKFVYWGFFKSDNREYAGKVSILGDKTMQLHLHISM